MFVNNINPVLLEFGPFQIRYYGIIYVLAFIVTYFFLYKVVERGRIKNFHKNDVEQFIIYLMLGVVLGSRLFEVIFFNPSYYILNPLKVFAFWEGGMSFHGGLFGSIAAIWFFCRSRKINFLDVADFLAVPAALFLSFGRIANFTNSELYGPISNASWCVQFQNVDGCRHPYQIYSAIKRFLIFLALFAIYQRNKFKRGFVMWLFILLMGLGRFIIDFWRAEATYGGFTMGQILSVFMILPAAFVLYRQYMTG